MSVTGNAIADYKRAKREKLLELRREHSLESWQPLGYGWYQRGCGGSCGCGYNYPTIESAVRGMMISIDVEVKLWVEKHAAQLEQWAMDEHARAERLAKVVRTEVALGGVIETAEELMRLSDFSREAHDALQPGDLGEEGER